MTVTLFSRAGGSIYSLSSEALVAYLDLPVKIEYLTKDKSNKVFEDLFAENNRFAPSLYDSDKELALNQQVAVNRYLLSIAKNTKELLGKKDEDKYEILQWTNRIDTDIVRHLFYIVKAAVNGKPLTAEQAGVAIKENSRGLDILEAHLQKNTYLVGESMTLADIEGAALLSIIAQTEAANFPPAASIIEYVNKPEFRQAYPAVLRWLNTILNTAPFTKLAARKAAAAKKAEKAATKSEKKSEKKAAPAAAPPAEKKAVHPCSLLGPSTIPIDALKREYSNKETRTEALPYFWNTFYNEDEWSLWLVNYKYNDELTQTFMSNNLIGGFFYRLSASTKYLFGAAVVYGENNNNGIRGAFVVRGKDYFPVFDVAPDIDSYEFTRVDVNDPAQRAEVDDLWSWDKPLIVDGEPREIADGKVFK